jgi:hypothetical protein
MTEPLTTIREEGVHAVEGPRGAPLLESARDIDRVLEACFSAECRAALLYADNLPAAFFDLSSGDAGAILQKLRNYGVRLAVVRDAGSDGTSVRFGELMTEERMRRDFGVFASREDALAWLAS